MKTTQKNTNRVVNVILKGGIIGMLADSPQNSLNRQIRKENANGWQVVQVIPSSSGNILLYVFRVILLLLTFTLYTTANGYYLILERMDNSTSKKRPEREGSTENVVPQTDNLFK